MPTFLQEAFRKQTKRHKDRSAVKPRKSPYKRPPRHQYKPYSRPAKKRKPGYSLGKETEGIVRTTGTLMAAGAAIGTMGLIGKLGK